MQRFISTHIIHRGPLGPRYLLIRRCGAYLPGTWQMVTGKIEDNETAYKAALREIEEETGLIPTTLYSADAVETFYMPGADEICHVPAFVAFTNSTDVRLSPSEHDAFEWLFFEEAITRLVWAEQRRVLRHIHEHFVLQTPSRILRISRAGAYALITQEGKVLLTRHQEGPHMDKWDLPGGGIEQGETPEEALHRELKEEIAMSCSSAQFLERISVQTAVPHGVFHQVGWIYRVDGLTPLNTAQELEHKWVELESLFQLTLAPLARHILSIAIFLRGKELRAP